MVDIIQIDRHSLIPKLVDENGFILDGGCRGFVFSNYFTNLGLNVIAIDPDPFIKSPKNKKISHIKKALTHDKNQKHLYYESWSTGEGNYTHTKRTNKPNYSKQSIVPAITIEEIMDDKNIDQFEIVKLDCEGAEYKILSEMEFPIAKQITIEFHDFLGRNPTSPNSLYYENLFKKLNKWYKVIQHEWGPMKNGGCQVENYWDSLLVLKDLL
jgi:FkbM family methyltransferase